MKCDMNMRDSRRNFSRYYNVFVDLQEKQSRETQMNINPFIAYADFLFEKEKIITWMWHTLYLRETPGHSEGSICILVDDKYLFSGDTLLKDDLTGVGFLGGNKEALINNTLPWLMSLPRNLRVFPGHGDSFYLKERLSKPIV